MIFNKDYVITLCFIFYADKNNRYEIANLIRIIPKELIDRIQNISMNDDITDKLNLVRLLEMIWGFFLYLKLR